MMMRSLPFSIACYCCYYSLVASPTTTTAFPLAATSTMPFMARHVQPQPTAVMTRSPLRTTTRRRYYDGMDSSCWDEWDTKRAAATELREQAERARVQAQAVHASLQQLQQNKNKKEPNHPNGVPTTTTTTSPQPSQRRLVTVAGILAMNAGLWNGLALSGVLVPHHRHAVAAVTGTWTGAALQLGQGRFHEFWSRVGLLVCYTGGSFVQALVNPHPGNLNWSQRRTATPLLLAAALLVLSAVVYPQCCHSPVLCQWLWKMLPFCFGLQNSFTSTLLQGNVLRSAHFSGITSDVGTVLGQVARGNSTHAWKLRIWCTLAACFVTGGLLSVVVQQWHIPLPVVSLVSAAQYVMVWACLCGGQRWGLRRPRHQHKQQPLVSSMNNDSSTTERPPARRRRRMTHSLRPHAGHAR